MPMQNFVGKMEKITERLNERVAYINGIVILGIVALIVIDVSGRYLMNRPLVASVEIATVMLAFIAFLSYAHGLIKGRHVQVTFLLERLSERSRLYAQIAVGIVGIAFFSVLCWGGASLFWESWVIKELMPAAVPFPFWLPKFMLPLGAFLMTIQCFIYFLRPVAMLIAKGEKQ